VSGRSLERRKEGKGPFCIGIRTEKRLVTSVCGFALTFNKDVPTHSGGTELRGLSSPLLFTLPLLHGREGPLSPALFLPPKSAKLNRDSIPAIAFSHLSSSPSSGMKRKRMHFSLETLHKLSLSLSGRRLRASARPSWRRRRRRRTTTNDVDRGEEEEDLFCSVVARSLFFPPTLVLSCHCAAAAAAGAVVVVLLFSRSCEPACVPFSRVESPPRPQPKGRPRGRKQERRPLLLLLLLLVCLSRWLTSRPL